VTHSQSLGAIDEKKVSRAKKALRTRVLNKEGFRKMKKPWITTKPYDISNGTKADFLIFLRIPGSVPNSTYSFKNEKVTG